MGYQTAGQEGTKTKYRKKRIYTGIAALAALFVLSEIQIPVYAGSSEGVCFYFGRMQEQDDTGSLQPGDEPASGDNGGDKWADREPEAGITHWKLGDTVTREIDGQMYRFRCIDQNYSDASEHHRQGALFLCDTVIPADTGSAYEIEELEDGSHGYVFHPGPIVDFGDTNDYKYSRVRRWLQAAETLFGDAEPIDTGVSRAYTGSTQQGRFDQLYEPDLRPTMIGSQKMTDRLFILSVDEALKYRNWLWKFNGAGEDNPRTQIQEYCKGYWLRSPAGAAEAMQSGQVYVVDLAKGNLHPATVRSGGRSEPGFDPELEGTSIYGVRPAFVLPQDQI